MFAQSENEGHNVQDNEQERASSEDEIKVVEPHE